MATATSTARPTSGGDYTLVDPRAPRFGQAITASGLLLGIGFQEPAFIFAIGVILNTAFWSRWRIHPYSIVWKYLIGPALDAPNEPEPAAPHRFATVIGAFGTLLASVLYLAGFSLAAYIIAGGIAGAAGLGATTGFCLGCHMYQSVSLFRRLDIV